MEEKKNFYEMATIVKEFVERVAELEEPSDRNNVVGTVVVTHTLIEIDRIAHGEQEKQEESIKALRFLMTYIGVELSKASGYKNPYEFWEDVLG